MLKTSAHEPKLPTYTNLVLKSQKTHVFFMSLCFCRAPLCLSWEVCCWMYPTVFGVI